MRADLLHQVATMRDVTNAILLTHNIDFVFLQSVAMSYLRRCGDPSLTIFADADCAAASYHAQRELLDGMGTRYRVVPIRMHAGFVFHPKALLLTGPQQATLYVGSGNLTFGGFRQNGEVWSRFAATDDGRAVFDEFRAYLSTLLSHVPMPGTIQAEIDDAFDARTKFWLGNAPAGLPSLIGRAGGNERALIDSLSAAFGANPIQELVVCSPYFDADGDALSAVRARLPHERALLLHPGRGSTLTAKAWAGAGAGMTRRPCEIRHPHEIEDRPAFVHAKFIAAIRGDDAIVIQGSANCTRAALLMDGPRGNAELMAVVHTSAANFRSEWLDALPETADREFAADDIVEEDAPTTAVLQILAARAEDGVILVAYHPASALIRSCSIDGKAVAFSSLEPGRLHIPHLGAAPSLVVEGLIDSISTTSLPHWVDQEHQLRATARRRRLEDTIPRTLGGERWSSDQWIELLQALGEHLRYTPIRSAASATPPRPKVLVTSATRRYEDLFAKDFSADQMLAHWREDVTIGEAHDSVRKLLMRWLGIGQEEQVQGVVSDAPPSEATSQGEGDQMEDIPPVPQLTTTAPAQVELTERMREKMHRILSEIEATVTADAYLEFRPPDFLRSDLMMMSVILRFGYGRGWLSHEAFFAFTHAVWGKLFLSSARNPQQGWLEWRRDSAPDATAFAEAIQSPQLSASMLAWSLIGIEAQHSVVRGRFLLARALSVARLPELWFSGGVEEIAKELADILRAGKVSIDGERVVALWREPLAQGIALRALDELLEILGLDEARRVVDAPSVRAGELLWQGKAGFCITLAQGSRLSLEPISTLKIQIGGTGAFRGQLTLPIRQMLEHHEIAEALDPVHSATLVELLDRLAENVLPPSPDESLHRRRA